MTSELNSIREIVIFENQTSLSLDAAYRFVAHYSEAVSNQNLFRAALTGGTGAVELYRIIASEPFSKLFDWEKVHLFFGDERCVPTDSENSNYLLARRNLIANIPIPAKNVHRIAVEMYDADAAAYIYEKELIVSFGVSENEIPAFDLILLGMGPDGHCASLFPHMPALHISDRLAAATEPGLEPFVQRVTLTLPVLNNAKNVLFLVHGEKKAEMVRMVLKGDSKPDELPSQSVIPLNGKVTWLLDQEAAGRLTGS